MVDKGFHVNSNAPAEDYLTALKLVLNPGGGLVGGDVRGPKATLEKYDFGGISRSPSSPAISIWW